MAAGTGPTRRLLAALLTLFGYLVLSTTAYAQAVRVLPAEIVARYTSSRRVAYVTPLPMQTPLQAAREGQGGRRFGVAIAFVLLLILLSLALSIVLKPRGHDMPAELSSADGSGVMQEG